MCLPRVTQFANLDLKLKTLKSVLVFKYRFELNGRARLCHQRSELMCTLWKDAANWGRRCRWHICQHVLSPTACERQHITAQPELRLTKHNTVVRGI